MEQCGQVKEPYMETLKSVILDQEHITAVKRVSFVFVIGYLVYKVCFSRLVFTSLCEGQGIVPFFADPLFCLFSLTESLAGTCLY